MCGIAGIWGVDNGKVRSVKVRVETMAASIRHRGPDDAGVWEASDHGICLAHQRLAIQDLSELGHQPMASASRRYVIVFNGEIYNFKRLSSELARLGAIFRGHSDTEVMLAAFDFWGVEQALSRFDGMFAFAVYDYVERELWLARDRMGEKPLYYSFSNGCLLFCSELKGILEGAGTKFKLNWAAIGSYFRFGYFSSTESPFENVRKLGPASFVRLRNDELLRLRDSNDVARKERSYWHLTHPDQVGLGAENLEEGLEKILAEAVLDQSVADVSVGVFLSGGIDSTLVAALLQKNSDRKINTYTIAFDSAQYNEAPFASEVARHLGTEHTEIPLAIDECMGVIEKLPEFLDEPFADASVIPTYLVCREARKHVTVCLSGDGGDELFGGYNRYIQGAKLNRFRQRVPLAVRSLSSAALLSVPEYVFDAAYSPISHIMTAAGRKPEKDVGAKLHKIARGLGARSVKELYGGLLSFWHESPLLASVLFPSAEDALKNCYTEGEDFSTSAMACDLSFYLVCDNLFKVDRAAMMNSLEVRLPLLDRRVVEFSATVPVTQKIFHGQSKHILREVLYRYVPRELISRPKMGFSVPLGEWLRTGMKDWAGSLLQDDGYLRSAGLDPYVVKMAWSTHLSGRADNANGLWTVLVYLKWHSAYSRFIQAV